MALLRLKVSLRPTLVPLQMRWRLGVAVDAADPDWRHRVSRDSIVVDWVDVVACKHWTPPEDEPSRIPTRKTSVAHHDDRSV